MISAEEQELDAAASKQLHDTLAQIDDGSIKIPPGARLLLVDDDDIVRSSLCAVLERGGFHVTTASNVNEALALIASSKFDVLLSDLRMPGAGDGLTVVSAMRHKDPRVVTIIFSGYPEMKEAAAAILFQADEILVKPMHPTELLRTLQQRLRKGPTPNQRKTVKVADILEKDINETIAAWLARVEEVPEIIAVRLSAKERSAYLPHLIGDLVKRLRQPLPLGTRALLSPAAASHGVLRRKQGYTAAMIVEESRLLQVSLFETLHNNLHQVDFSLLLLDVMSIADEVDSQLAQAMTSYISDAKADDKQLQA